MTRCKKHDYERLDTVLQYKKIYHIWECKNCFKRVKDFCDDCTINKTKFEEDE